MRTSLLLAPALLAAFAATPAHADHTIAACDMAAGVVAETTTYQQYEGLVYGYMIGAPGEAVAFSCVVLANGEPVDAPRPARGTTVAVTSERANFRSAPGAQLEVCIEYTDSHGMFQFHCHGV